MRGRRGVAEFWFGVAADALVRAPGEHMRMILHDFVRGPRPAPLADVHARRHRDAGARHRRQHGDLQRRPRRGPPGAAQPGSGRLVRLWEKNDKLNIPRFSARSPNYYSWRERVQAFEELAAWRSSSATLTTGGEPQRVSKLEATWTMLPLLDIRPIAGRTFTAEEDRPGGARVALLGRIGAGAIASAALLMSSASRSLSTASPTPSSASSPIAIS